MNELTIPLVNFPEFAVSQLTALPSEELPAAYGRLHAASEQLKDALAKFQAALEQRYSEQARAARLEAGKDFGVIHLSDGPVRVTVDQPKRVTWDQQQLAAIASRIAAAGENVSDYIDIEYSVSESRFGSWPPALRAQFEAARTVKPGKPSFRLALIDDLGA